MEQGIALLSQIGNLGSAGSGQGPGTKTKDLDVLPDLLLKAGLSKEDIEKLLSSSEGLDFSVVFQELGMMLLEKGSLSEGALASASEETLGQLVEGQGQTIQEKGAAYLALLLMKGDLPEDVYERLWTQIKGVSDVNVGSGEVLRDSNMGLISLDSVSSLWREPSTSAPDEQVTITSELSGDNNQLSTSLSELVQLSKLSRDASAGSLSIDKSLGQAQIGDGLSLGKNGRARALGNVLLGRENSIGVSSRGEDISLGSVAFYEREGKGNDILRSIESLHLQLARHNSAQLSGIGGGARADAIPVSLANLNTKVVNGVFDRHSIAVEVLNRVEHVVKQSVVMNKIPGGVRISLNPPELGHLKIDLSYEGENNLKVHILADKPMAYEILKDNSHSLREHLVENTHFMDVKVELAHTPRSDHQGMWFEDRNRRRSYDFSWDKRGNSVEDEDFSDILEGVINRLV